MSFAITTAEIKSTTFTRVRNSTPASEAIKSKLEQEVEFQDLFCAFVEVAQELNDQAKN